LPVSPAFVIRLTLAAGGLALLLPSIAAAAAQSPEAVTARAAGSVVNPRAAAEVVTLRTGSAPSPSPYGSAVTPAGSPRPAFTVGASDLKELSGLAMSDAGDAFYGIQDAGNGAEVFVLDRSGQALGTIPVPFPNTDWEDIALIRQPGRTGFLYISDTGDASLARKADKLAPRTEFSIIRIDEPDISRPQTLRAAGDAAAYPVTFAGDEHHNVESILVEPASGRVYLIDKVAKGDDAKPAGVWEGPAVLSTGGNEFHRIATLPITGISSGSFSPGGRFIAVRDADHAYLWPTGASGVASALAAVPAVITLPKEPQGESLTFTPDGVALLVGSEGEENPVLSVPLPASFHDPLYPFTVDEAPNRAPLYLLAFGGAAAVLLALVIAVRRRRLGSDF
jgi:hypothetical protein